MTCHISPVLKVRCIILRWMSFCYRRTFVFVLDIFVSPWRDVRPQLQCIYPYLLIIPEWNPKLLASNGTLLLNQNPIVRLRTVTILFTFAFVVTRHSCHRCVYLMVVVIFAVVACMINFFIKTYLLSLFLIIFWWLGTFCDHVIFRSTSKAFPRWKFRISVRWNINLARFFLFLSNPFEAFFCRMIITSTKCALFLDIVCSLIV